MADSVGMAPQSVAELPAPSERRSDATSDRRRVPSREEIAFTVRLAVLALFGDALFGDELAQAPPAEREAEGARFRQWLSELLTERVAHERGD